MELAKRLATEFNARLFCTEVDLICSGVFGAQGLVLREKCAIRLVKRGERKNCPPKVKFCSLTLVEKSLFI